MTLSLQDGIGISVLVVGEDMRPWHKSQIQPFNERGISTTMVASMQGDASITRTELGVGKVPENYSYCSSRSCKYPSGHSRNTRYGESQQIALTNTNARMALSSCSLFTELRVLSSCRPTPNYQLLLTQREQGCNPTVFQACRAPSSDSNGLYNLWQWVHCSALWVIHVFMVGNTQAIELFQAAYLQLYSLWAARAWAETQWRWQS